MYVVEAWLVYLLAFWISGGLLRRPIPPVGSKTFVLFLLLWPFLRVLALPGLRRIPILGDVFAAIDGLIAAMAPVAAEYPRESKASRLFGQARHCEECGNLEKAIRIYRLVQVEAGGTPLAEDAAKAAVHAERLLEANREAEGLLKSGISLEVRGRPAEARGLYEQVLRDHPTSRFAAEARNCLESLERRLQE
jgi:tetratricopeptide (TPR) repeat protein